MATKIMVVDDEEDYRIILHDILSNAGHEVRLAANGQEALAALDEFAPDIMIVDWLMPVMDGPELVGRLRRSREHKAVPIIMLTVRQTADDEIEALHFGVDDYVVKPFEGDDLLARITAVLRRASSRPGDQPETSAGTDERA